MDRQEALQALEGVEATRRRMAGRARWSFARHAAVGLLMGGLVASYSLPEGWPFFVALACIAATGAIIARDRKRDGFFVNGYRRGRTRPLTFALCGGLALALSLAIGLRQIFQLVWAPLAIGVLVAGLATWASIAWERIYRRELGAGDDDD